MTSLFVRACLDLSKYPTDINAVGTNRKGDLKERLV